MLYDLFDTVGCNSGGGANHVLVRRLFPLFEYYDYA
jgi:hypothetical protein